MKRILLNFLLIIGISLMSFMPEKRKTGVTDAKVFKWITEQFADAKILRYKVPGFENLSLKQKELIYYLSQATLAGRDITYDQNCKYNLLIRKTLEAIYSEFKGDRSGDDFKNFTVYLKRVWFSNGIHHHYSTDKFFPEFSKDYFASLLRSMDPQQFPLKPKQTIGGFINEITPIIFDPDIASKRVNQNPDVDMVVGSASNFYEGVTQNEAEGFYVNLRKNAGKTGLDTLVAFGLNTKLVKENGKVVEKTYRVSGLYSRAIEKIVFWLNKAMNVAENPEQRAVISKLIEYYRSGDLKTWDEYNILWVKDQKSSVDFINGFIEVYGDPLAKKGTWEAMANFKDVEATKRTETLSRNAQYFENNSPVDPKYKKKEVKGVTAKVITAVQLGGDSDPTTPIGINLPNAQWIRKEFGSKSVTIDNITYAYDQASQGNGFLEEFAGSQEEIDLAKKYGYLAGNLTTDLHECLGHGSGQMMKGVVSESLKNYHSTIEEARADLFALYYIMDKKMIDLGLVPSPDLAKAEFNSYIRNGLMTQLVRVHPGKDVEEAHMRDRSLIAHWVYEKGKVKNVIEKVQKDGKTWFRINDYQELRSLFGQLLGEIQRITSEGDYPAAKELVEAYAVKVDPELHKEVLNRYAKLNITPYSGFINPVYTPVMANGVLKDIKISYTDDFTTQMLRYSKDFSFLPAR
ncbi:MAG: dihydrofolate reductase [Bacteroidetes bacterium]|nr:MAG: dihydrofolate reductase [Bacteroidota bacterium]